MGARHGTVGIALFAMDVDGTLTDGAFYIDGTGNEYKRFDVKDGYGIERLMRAGIKTAFISGRHSSATDARAQRLGVDIVINGSGPKLPHLERIAAELGISREQVAFIGDDLPDLECVCWAGLGIAVSDATEEVLRAADWIAPRPGGFGAVRAAADYILRLCSDR